MPYSALPQTSDNADAILAAFQKSQNGGLTGVNVPGQNNNINTPQLSSLLSGVYSTQQAYQQAVEQAQAANPNTPPYQIANSVLSSPVGQAYYQAEQTAIPQFESALGGGHTGVGQDLGASDQQALQQLGLATPQAQDAPGKDGFNPFIAAAVLSAPFTFGGSLGALSAAGEGADAAATAGSAAAGSGGFLSGVGSTLGSIGSSLSSIPGALVNSLGGGFLGGVGSGALTGAGIGGISSALTGGNILKGAESGGLLGGIGGGASNLFSQAGGLTGIGNSVGGLFGDSTLGTDLSNFSPTSSLSSLFGGTAQPTSNLTNSLNGIVGNAGDADTALSAASPANQALSGVLPGSTSLSPAGGGVSGAGFNLSGIGGDSLPSSSGIGSGIDASASGDFGSGVAGLQSAPTSLQVGSVEPLAASSDVASYANAPIPQNPGGLQGLISGGATNGIGSGIDTNASGAFGSGVDSSVSGGFGSGLTYAAPSGGNVGTTSGILGNLFGGGSQTGGSSNLVNGLLRAGVGGLLTNNNTSGYNGITNAAQQAQSNYQPYLASGTAANNTLSSLYGNNGAAAEQAAQANFSNTPGYQFALTQGLNAVNADAASKGQLLSGNNQQAVQQYGTGLANQTYNNYVQNLQQQAGTGLSAAGGAGTAGLTAAASQAQLGQNQANNQNNTYAGLLQALFPNTNSASGNSGLLGFL